jgi:hypothetical protein
MIAPKNNTKIELGDWQTPADLAGQVCRVLLDNGICPESIIEPTCGKGAFLQAAMATFSSAKECFGLDISDEYLSAAGDKIRPFVKSVKTKLVNGDFFFFQWEKQIEAMPAPVLVIGNPPWVTNSGIGSIGGRNLPAKSNFQNMKGLDAITGKSNFDISEWMIIRMLEVLKNRRSYLAMLCKTAVARKVLLHGWKNSMPFEECSIFKINSKQHFDVTVDACLFVVKLGGKQINRQCKIYSELNLNAFEHIAAFENGRLVPAIDLYGKWKHLAADSDEPFKWRSGIKHDCANVMEIFREGDFLKNKLGEVVDVDDEYLYPMLKSSDLANGEIKTINRYMLVTQHFVGQQTSVIKQDSPKTWEYLQKYADLLGKRTSVIYKNNPPFSIFGVGDYTFTDWKIAVSGFYKKLRFRLIGPYENKPVVFDDTCYFLGCRTQDEAQTLYELLSSQAAAEFLTAHIWWDSKRPITLEILNMLSIVKLADYYKKEVAFKTSDQHQLTMF